MPFDAFCKIDGIPGESTDDGHAEWIELERMDQLVSQPPAEAGKSTRGGRVDFGPFYLVKQLDKATPNLWQHLCSSKTIPNVEIQCCQAAGDKHLYMKFTLKKVTIASMQLLSEEGPERPLEKVGLNFAEIAWEYTPIADGVAGATDVKGWSAEKNAAV
jgi:type VI secretion system secreted protein Hcp